MEKSKCEKLKCKYLNSETCGSQFHQERKLSLIESCLYISTNDVDLSSLNNPYVQLKEMMDNGTYTNEQVYAGFKNWCMEIGVSEQMGRQKMFEIDPGAMWFILLTHMNSILK